MTALLAKAAPVSGAGPYVAGDVLRGMFDRVVSAAALPVVVAAVLGVAAAVITGRDVRRRDPVRRFTRQQRREGMARAGGHCELEAGFGRRCGRPAEHGDHFYPWSKGGSTSLQNFVAACARCNRAKRARIPSPGQQRRMERRRREYLPPSTSPSVGERQPLP
ncbi:HNH endonuclease [Arthrobacter sp. MAHUQ-56]